MILVERGRADNLHCGWVTLQILRVINCNCFCRRLRLMRRVRPALYIKFHSNEEEFVFSDNCGRPAGKGASFFSGTREDNTGPTGTISRDSRYV